MVHYYDFEHSTKTEDPVEKVEAKVKKALLNLGVAFEICSGRVVRSTGPNWHQVVLDIKIVSSVNAFGRIWRAVP
jgi:tRNA G37 N-methylase Trm5